MKRYKKREFQASELVHSLSKIYGFEEKLLALEIKKFLQNYLDENISSAIDNIYLSNGLVSIQIKSPLLKNDFRMRRSFYLERLQQTFGKEKISDLVIS